MKTLCNRMLCNSTQITHISFDGLIFLGAVLRTNSRANSCAEWSHSDPHIRSNITSRANSRAYVWNHTQHLHLRHEAHHSHHVLHLTRFLILSWNILIFSIFRRKQSISFREIKARMSGLINKQMLNWISFSHLNSVCFNS